jgi:hypothetical protein
MVEAIVRMMDQESERVKANQRIIARMESAADLGTGGVITWTREELHER